MPYKDKQKACESSKRSWRKNHARTYCYQGHELTADNIYSYIDKSGHERRSCKICAKDKYNRRFLQLRDNHLQRKFGIGLKEYEEMLIRQEGKCAICGTTVPGGNGMKNGRGSFHVDHDHYNGQVRKLLCTNCNTALGAAKDSPDLLRKMADYLESFKEHNE
jgi:hypothetical protein